MATSPSTIDEYIAAFSPEVQAILQEIRVTISNAAPDAEETISYRIPAFKAPIGMLVWYAAFSDHCSLFPTASVIEKFKEDLKDFRVSKGTIHFPVDKPLPAALVKKMVKARLADKAQSRL